jgi:Family of unknown function (DUF5309)
MPVATWNTASFPADLAKKSFSAMITRLMPNGQAPLFGLTSMLKEETAYQPEHGYFSKTMIFPMVNLDAAVADGAATTFTVASSANILPGMILQADTTRENVLVVTVPTSTSITVARGIGTVAAAAIANDVNLWMVGNAYEEASVRPQSLIIVPTRVINYTQIFRNTWLTSGTSAATAVIAGSAPDAENKSDCASFHAADIEKALIFGQSFSGTRNSMPFRCMDGLINRVTVAAAGNVTTLGATTTYTQLEAALDPVFNVTTDPKVANERVLFVGGFARRVIHTICRLNSTYMINDQTTEWGLQFDTIKIPRGRFNLVEHPMLNAFGAATSWAKMAIAVDLSSFGTAYMTGRKTQNREFNMSGTPVDNGVDAVGGTLTTEMTCLVKNPAANGVLYNFTAGLAG